MDLLEKAKKQQKKEESKPKGKIQAIIDNIKKETGLDEKEIRNMIEEKRAELKGLISEEGALFIVEKELGVVSEKTGKFVQYTAEDNAMFEEEPPKKVIELKKELPKVEPKKTKKKPLKKEKIEVPEINTEVEIISNDEIPTKSYPIQPIESPSEIMLPTKQDVDRHLEMYNYVKSKVVNESDFATIKNKKFLKKSGVRKFINAFGISIELIDKKIFTLEVNGVIDTHAEVRVRAITQKGQSVEGIGMKSMSELYDKNLHNLVATAWTRAVNRAILDLVAFGEVSAEELMSSGSKNNINMDEMF